MPAHTRTHPHTPAHTRAYPRTPHTPHTYPLMPADALNLINHMKLHVNGKMAEREIDREIDREKKEGTRVR